MNLYFEYFYHVQSYSRTKKEKSKQINYVKALIVINITLRQNGKTAKKKNKTTAYAPGIYFALEPHTTSEKC